MVWATSPVLSVATLLLRFIAALFPLSSLWVAKLIIDLVVKAIRNQPMDRSLVWKLLIIELFLAVGSDVLGRLISLVDSFLGDRFTNYVSLRLDAACHVVRPGFLRRSSVLRQNGAGPAADDRAVGHAG